jgi:hypothetical protein
MLPLLAGNVEMYDEKSSASESAVAHGFGLTRVELKQADLGKRIGRCSCDRCFQPPYWRGCSSRIPRHVVLASHRRVSRRAIRLFA